jgi:hypothetical protein
MKNICGHTFTLLGCLIVTNSYARIAVEDMSSPDLSGITNGSAIAPLLPPGYKEPVFSGLMEDSERESMRVKWGAAPAFMDIVPEDTYNDSLPLTGEVKAVVYEDTPIKGVFEDLAQQMQISYITPENLEADKTLNARFYNMTPTNIFRAVMASNRLELREKFGAYTLIERQPPQPFFRKYKLDFNFLDDGEVSTAAAGGGSSSNNNNNSSSNNGSATSLSGTVESDYSGFTDNIEKLAQIEITN